MPDQHPDPDHLRKLARHDPIDFHFCVRRWRNAEVAAAVASFVVVAVRPLGQFLKALR